MHTHFDPKKSKVAIVCNFYVNEFKFSQLNNKLKIYIEFFLFVALHGLIYKHLKNLYRISLMQLVQSSFFAIFFLYSLLSLAKIWVKVILTLSARLLRTKKENI